MPSGSIAIVAGASAEEFDHVKQCLSDWQCVAAPLNDEETEVSSMPAASERRLKKFIFAFQYYSLLKRAVLLYSQSKFRCLALCEALES